MPRRRRKQEHSWRELAKRAVILFLMGFASALPATGWALDTLQVAATMTFVAFVNNLGRRYRVTLREK